MPAARPFESHPRQPTRRNEKASTANSGGSFYSGQTLQTYWRFFSSFLIFLMAFFYFKVFAGSFLTAFLLSCALLIMNSPGEIDTNNAAWDQYAGIHDKTLLQFQRQKQILSSQLVCASASVEIPDASGSASTLFRPLDFA